MKLQKKNKFRIPRKLKKKVTKGMYCYVFTGKTSKVWDKEFNQYVTAFQTKCCPFYFTNELGYGDCKYLIKKYNLDLNGSEDRFDICLDDQCKSCSLNDKIDKKDLK